MPSGVQSPSTVVTMAGSSTKYVSPRSPMSAGSNAVGACGTNHQGPDALIDTVGCQCETRADWQRERRQQVRHGHSRDSSEAVRPPPLKLRRGSLVVRSARRRSVRRPSCRAAVSTQRAEGDPPDSNQHSRRRRCELVNVCRQRGARQDRQPEAASIPAGPTATIPQLLVELRRISVPEPQTAAASCPPMRSRTRLRAAALRRISSGCHQTPTPGAR